MQLEVRSLWSLEAAHGGGDARADRTATGIGDRPDA